jgi:uncharacterized membrane protein YcaP (DUF421 family)
MKKEEIHLDDIRRILFGQAPPVFLLEVFLRTIIVFICLLVVVRWLGKRMSGQLTIMEMAVMLTLGAIVSVGMQMPDRGFGLTIFGLLCTLLFHRGLGYWGFKNSRIEELTQGKMSLLVADGVMVVKEMDRCRISRQQLLAQLRGKGIKNLGKVKRVYMEACGAFSIFESANERPGLPVLPPDDRVPEVNYAPEWLACVHCGFVKRKQEIAEPHCRSCGCKDWTEAVA